MFIYYGQSNVFIYNTHAKFSYMERVLSRCSATTFILDYISIHHIFTKILAGCLRYTVQRQSSNLDNKALTTSDSLCCHCQRCRLRGNRERYYIAIKNIIVCGYFKFSYNYGCLLNRIVNISSGPSRMPGHPHHETFIQDSILES